MNRQEQYETLLKTRVRFVLILFAVGTLLLGFYVNHLLQLSIKNSLKVQKELSDSIQPMVKSSKGK